MRCVAVLALALAGWLIPQLAGAQAAPPTNASAASVVPYTDDEAADIMKRLIAHEGTGPLPAFEFRRFTDTQANLVFAAVAAHLDSIERATKTSRAILKAGVTNETREAAPVGPSPTLAQISGVRIAVYVTPPERGGFSDTDKDLSDSIKDLQNNIRNKRGLLVAKDRASADVVLRVNNRGRASEATGGVVAVPLGNGAIAAPIRANYKFVETTLEAGTFKKDFNAADDGYGDCAEKIARQVNAWIEANHSTLMEHRATRVR